MVNVEIMCRTIWKFMCKSRVNFCEKLLFTKNHVYKIFYPPAFPTYFTAYSTTHLQINQTNFSTIPQTLLLQLHNFN